MFCPCFNEFSKILLQALFQNVSLVSKRCCNRSDLDVSYTSNKCCNNTFEIFQLLQYHVAVVVPCCCKCFYSSVVSYAFSLMLQQLFRDVAIICSWRFSCFSLMLQQLFHVVAIICSWCFSCFSVMLQ